MKVFSTAKMMFSGELDMEGVKDFYDSWVESYEQVPHIIHDPTSLCPKSPSVQGFVASLPVLILFKAGPLR